MATSELDAVNANTSLIALPLPAAAGLCVLVRFFWCGVDVALMLGARMRKAPRGALCMSLLSNEILVAGAGFEPAAFRL